VTEPRYTFTPEIVGHLMAIEAARATVRLTPLPLHVAERLRQRALLRSTPCTARGLLASWVAAGCLEIVDSARKTRRYRLSAEYRQLIGGITA